MDEKRRYNYIRSVQYHVLDTIFFTSISILKIYNSNIKILTKLIHRNAQLKYVARCPTDWDLYRVNGFMYNHDVSVVGLFQCLGMCVHMYLENRRERRGVIHQVSEILQWGLPHHWKKLQSTRLLGFLIHTYIYQIIPILYIYFYVGKVEDWMLNILIPLRGGKNKESCILRALET